MARGSKATRFRDFHKGLNTADGVYNLAEGEARDLLNVVSRDRGNVKKRPGCTTLLAHATVKDLSPVDVDAQALLLYSDANGELRGLRGNTLDTSLATGLSAIAPWKFLRAPAVGGQGPYWGMNGVDAPRYVTAAATPTSGLWTASSGTLPNGKFFIYSGNRLWVAGVASDPYAVFFSEVGDLRTWPVENVTRFGVDDGSPITGLGAVGNYILVFKERSLWAIYDIDTSANRKVAENAGTLSGRAIVDTERGCFFLDSELGVSVTDGQTVKRVSDQILPTIRSISNAALADVAAVAWGGHLYMGVTTGAGRQLLDYDMELDSWWIHSHQTRALAVWDRGDGRQLFGAHPSSIARLMVDGEKLDEGVIFTSYWSAPYHDFDTPYLNKRVRELTLDGRGRADVYVQSDFNPGTGPLEQRAEFNPASLLWGGGGDFAGDGIFGGGVLIGEDSLLTLGVGRVWSMSIGSSLEDEWQLDSYTYLTDQRKD